MTTMPRSLIALFFLAPLLASCMGTDSQSISLTPSQHVVAVVTTERGITGADVTVVNHFQCGKMPVWNAERQAYQVTEEDTCVALAPFAGTTAAPFSQLGNAAVTAVGEVLAARQLPGGGDTNVTSGSSADGGDANASNENNNSNTAHGGKGGSGGSSRVGIDIDNRVSGGGRHCANKRCGGSHPNWGKLGS